jgi:glycosyltransferase involved in cell wall biosynthesis
MIFFSFVSVIIPVYKDWDRIKLCLDSLAKQSYPSNSYEILIINNGDREEIPKWLNNNNQSNLKIFSETQKGSYAARNKGINESIGEIIAFIDSDCIADTNWIMEGAKLINGGKLRVAGKISIFPKNPSNPNLAEIYDMVFGFDQESSSKSGLSVTANLFVKREIIDRVGLFKSSMLSGGDTDWSKRASKIGIGLSYSDQVQISHPARSSSRDLFMKRARVSRKLKSRKINTNKVNKFEHYFKRSKKLFHACQSNPFKYIAVLFLALSLRLLGLINYILFRLSIAKPLR